jgi:transposase-like protein
VSTDPIGVDPCPYCGGTSGVKVITNTPTKVRGWSCAACGTDWWISVVNPRPYLDQLAARVTLRQVIALADAAPALWRRATARSPG